MEIGGDEWVEGQFSFDFSILSSTVERPDRVEDHLRTTDFIFRHGGETWLIECKDVDSTPIPHRQSQVEGLISEIENQAYLKKVLLPKLYGTCAYLALNNKFMRGRIRYAVIIGFDFMDALMMSTLTDSVQSIVDQIGPKLRHSRHVPIVEVHNVASWNAAHPEMSITRRT